MQFAAIVVSLVVTLASVSQAASILVKLGSQHNMFLGHSIRIPLLIKNAPTNIGSFRFRLVYNPLILRFESLNYGNAFDSTQFRVSCRADSTVFVTPLTLRIGKIAISGYRTASTQPLRPNTDGEWLVLNFEAKNDRNLEGAETEVCFVWDNCEDNTLTNIELDTVYCASLDSIHASVNTYRSAFGRSSGDANAKALSLAFSRLASCDGVGSDSVARVSAIQWLNGGVDFVSGGLREINGDLNLNGISYEISDAALMLEWLGGNDSVLDSNPQYRKAQFATSDVNRDGTDFSVADYVYLTRVIVGDALPFPKLTPLGEVAKLSFEDGVLAIRSPVDIGAVLIEAELDDSASEIENLSSLSMHPNTKGKRARVFLCCDQSKLDCRLLAGRNLLVRLPRGAKIANVEVSDYNGNLLVPMFQ